MCGIPKWLLCLLRKGTRGPAFWKHCKLQLKNTKQRDGKYHHCSHCLQSENWIQVLQNVTLCPQVRSLLYFKSSWNCQPSGLSSLLGTLNTWYFTSQKTWILLEWESPILQCENQCKNIYKKTMFKWSSKIWILLICIFRQTWPTGTLHILYAHYNMIWPIIMAIIR